MIKRTVYANCDFLPPNWPAYIDLDNICGYPRSELKSLADHPHDWLSVDTSSNYSPSWWSAAFARVFKENHVPMVSQFPSLHDYIEQRWLWTTSGATRISLLEDDQGVIKTKFGSALSLSNRDLHACVNTLTGSTTLPDSKLNYDSRIGVFVKPDEKGIKRRLVANVPLGQYILAAYITDLLKATLPHKHPLYHSDVDTDDILDVLNIIRRGDSVLVPLDESAYDHHFTRNTWLGFIMFLKDRFPGASFPTMFETYFLNGKWVYGEEEGPWNSGMPSGLAMTSFLNSVVNYIKQITLNPTAELKYASGDDALQAVRIADFKGLDAIQTDYATFGAEVHADKNWVARRFGEFLKHLFSREGTGGYPARIFSSLIWQGSEFEFDISTRLTEVTGLFKSYYDRASLPFNHGEVARDLAAMVSRRLAGFNTRVAERWVSTPRALGGFGLWPYKHFDEFTFSPVTSKRVHYRNAILNLPPKVVHSSATAWRVAPTSFSRTFSQAHTFVSPALHRALGSVIRSAKGDLISTAAALASLSSGPTPHVGVRFGRPPPLPPITSLDAWEARLNGTDVPEFVPKKYRNEYLSLIPLPSIRGVSDAFVSAFARRIGLYAYNNFRTGSSDTVKKRYITGSILLTQYISCWMLEHSIKTLL